jgi:hypothetical protein
VIPDAGGGIEHPSVVSRDRLRVEQGHDVKVLSEVIPIVPATGFCALVPRTLFRRRRAEILKVGFQRFLLVVEHAADLADQAAAGLSRNGTFLAASSKMGKAQVAIQTDKAFFMQLDDVFDRDGLSPSLR